MTVDASSPLMEDYLWLKKTFDGRRLLIEDYLIEDNFLDPKFISDSKFFRN